MRRTFRPPVARTRPSERPFGRLATVAAAALGLSTAALAGAFALALLPVVALRLAEASGVPASWDRPDPALVRVSTIAALGSVGLAAVAFVAWLRRTVGEAAGLLPVAPPASTRRDLAWWLVPPAILVAPYRLMRRLHDDLAVPGRSNAPVGLWWACWLVAAVPSIVALGWGAMTGFTLAVAVLPLVAGFLAVSRLAPRTPLSVRLVLALPATVVVLAALAVGSVGLTSLILASPRPDGVAVLNGALVETLGLGVAVAAVVLAVASGLLAIEVVLEVERRLRIRARGALAPDEQPLRAA